MIPVTSSVRLCPTCNEPLQPSIAYGTVVDTCMKCEGLWFDRAEIKTYLIRFLQEHRGVHDEPLEIRRSIPLRTSDPLPRRSCPSCGQRMGKLNYGTDSNIYLDRCSTCGGLWVERAQVLPLAQYVRGHSKLNKLGESMVEHDDSERWYDGVEQEMKEALGTWAFLRLLMIPLPAIIVPLIDSPRDAVFPWVTLHLLIVNILIFGMQWLFVPDIEPYFRLYGLVPKQILAGDGLHTVLTHMFVHGNLLHLGGNVLFLFIFGDNVESAFGHKTFLGFYLICGLVGASAFLLVHQNGVTPGVGSSGAISGVLGAYLMLFPRQHIRTFFLVRVLQIPAIVLLGLWFGYQLIWSLSELANPSLITSAFSVHVAGFVCGALLALTVNVLRPSTTGPPA